MEIVLVLGGTGCLGSCVLEVLKKRNYHVRATARTPLKAEQLKPSVDGVFVCDPTDASTLSPELLNGVTYIISALGKSLRLSDRSKTTFQDVDFKGNLNILKLAQAQGQIKKFVYVAAYSSEKSLAIAYFKAQEGFAQALQQSGIPATIVKPPALFSTVLDLMPVIKRGKIASLGAGTSLTNPIHELEVAEVCVDALHQSEKIIELGGPVAYSRLELMKLVSKQAGHSGRIPKVPYWAAHSFLSILKIMSRSLYEKASFFVKVSKTDRVAPARGRRRLEDYLEEHM